ncbi:MAG: sigma-54 dependent transcriptional regulator [Candidatus Bathyarchaeia archaeon]
MSKPTLLIVDDNEDFLTSMGRALQYEYEVRYARSKVEALNSLSPPPDIVLLDLRLDDTDPDNHEGMDVLRILRRQFPQMPIVMVTAWDVEVDLAVECMKLGAVDFIQKRRVNIKEIKTRLARALEQAQLTQRVAELEKEIQLIEPREIVGKSRAIQEIKRLIKGVAQDGYVTVLIRGETGTGKELIARAIHASGWRRKGPFVAVALASLPLSMVEPELFGYERGAFTDAEERHIGYIEKAHRGVLFLDEIGDLHLEVQSKLLRFLEEREFQRLGNTEPIKVDVQVLAATNANLEERVRRGLFRKDLYYRLKVHEIYIPPLRERTEDIPLLVEHFLHLFHRRGRRVNRISSEALETLCRCPWPGNVRQLKNAIESALFWAELKGHSQIEVEDLPPDVRQVPLEQPQAEVKRIDSEGFCVDEALARTELACIEEALKLTRGKKTEAWKLLGYHDRFTFYRRVRRILKRYPHLVEEFPQVKTSFGGRGRNRGSEG